MPFYRGSVDRYEVTATLLVIAIPVGALAFGVVAVAWARDAISRAPLPGLIGVFCTLVAAGNLFVQRTCGGMVNRPVITVALGTGDCHRSSLVAVELVVLLSVATSVVTRLGDVKRDRKHVAQRDRLGTFRE